MANLAATPGSYQPAPTPFTRARRAPGGASRGTARHSTCLNGLGTRPPGRRSRGASVPVRLDSQTRCLLSSHLLRAEGRHVAPLSPSSSGSSGALARCAAREGRRTSTRAPAPRRERGAPRALRPSGTCGRAPAPRWSGVLDSRNPKAHGDRRAPAARQPGTLARGRTRAGPESGLACRPWPVRAVRPNWGGPLHPHVSRRTSGRY